MSDERAADERAVLAAASSIADGVAVDWPHLAPGTDDTTTAVLDELRVVEGVSRLGLASKTWGAFTLLGEIGHGSYGTVYRALDTNLNLEVALKVVRPHPPRHDANRALNEARLLAQVTHPNVVRIYRAERLDDEVGVAMELLHGRTLDDLVYRQGPYSARETMLIGADLCCGLAAVHGARLVHGDLKAQNVMRVAGGRTVLMDFGAGYDVKTDGSSGRRFAGTPLYLAPEVFAGQARSPVSDIYSVGVLLFFLATGGFPVEGETGSEVRRKHEAGGARRLLRDVRADLPDAFIQVVERATSPRPADRYQTAGELEAALNSALRTAPTPVAPPLWGISKSSALIGAATVLLLAGAFGYSRWMDATPVGTGSTSTTTVATAGPVSTAAADDSYRIEAAFYVHRDGGDVRLAPGARVAPGDRLSLQVISSVPTHVYVVNEDDRGNSFLLFPLPGLRAANPLAPSTRHALPGPAGGEPVYWRVDTAGGREHFLIFASPQPLSPAFQRVFDALPRPSADAPVIPQPMSGELVGALRGVGGVAKAATGAGGAGLRAEFGLPLPAAEESARGVWVRQLTVENPGR